METSRDIERGAFRTEPSLQVRSPAAEPKTRMGADLSCHGRLDNPVEGESNWTMSALMHGRFRRTQKAPTPLEGLRLA